MKRDVIHPEGTVRPFGVWSPATLVTGGRTLYVSGITSRDEAGEVVGPGDMEAQTRQVCRMLQATVQAAGGSLSEVVSVTVHTTDITQFDTIHAVRREFFPTDPPSSTMVEVSRLVDERSQIEITAIAVINDDDEEMT